MPKVKNRLDQPLVVNLGPKTIRLGPKESRDITAKEKSARHLERLEKEGYIEFVSDDEVEKLLSGIGIKSFRTRDEQEVAGYAELMEMIFESFDEITLTENHIRQLHGVLLKYSEKDVRHRGEYKKFPNNVEAFDEKGRSVGVIFEAATGSGWSWGTGRGAGSRRSRSPMSLCCS